MSVIVARALPDVRDGLKPVQRRILYTMLEEGLRNDRPFRKSANVVGVVMAKYHPHGDVPIYDALVRLAQDFAARYPLVQGQGNFGCFTGETKVELYNGEQKPFTELVEMAHKGLRAEIFTVDPHRNVRIKPLRAPRLVRRNDPVVKVTLETGAEIVCTPDHRVMLRDGTPNYDNRHLQPTVLPARVPNLIVNGSAGIAVGMATNIPPHNLREIVAATKRLIDDPELTTDDLCETVIGPDFPGGGVIYRFDEQRNVETGAAERVDAIRRAYAQGRGRLIARGQAD